jgi:hypothetical protein
MTNINKEIKATVALLSPPVRYQAAAQFGKKIRKQKQADEQPETNLNLRFALRKRHRIHPRQIIGHSRMLTR